MSRAAISKATDVTEHPARKRQALRHGLHSPRLAKGLSYADRQAGIFRRALEDTLLARDGEITLHKAALAHTAVEAVKLASANRVEKRNASDAGKLTLELSIAMDREYLRALDLRDRKLEALGLAKTNSQSILDKLYAKPRLPQS